MPKIIVFFLWNLCGMLQASGDRIAVLWMCWASAAVSQLLVCLYSRYLLPSALCQSEQLWLQDCFLRRLLHIYIWAGKISAWSCYQWISRENKSSLNLHFYIFKWSITFIKFLDKHRLSLQLSKIKMFLLHMQSRSSCCMDAVQTASLMAVRQMI